MFCLVLLLLCDKIYHNNNNNMQVDISTAIKQQIKGETKHLPAISESLANLDIAIGFLASVGGNPKQKIIHYMQTDLSMNTDLCSQKVKLKTQI